MVGLGISGLCVAYLLAKKGKSVIGLEKNSTSGGYMTGSYGTTRAYMEYGTWTEAKAFWQELEKESNQTLMV